MFIASQRKTVLNYDINSVLSFNMLLKLYSFVVLLVDIFWVTIIAIFATIGNFIRYLKPLPLKSVKDEVVMLINSFLPEMKEKNHGHIVALTSVAGLSQLKEYMALTAAQFGIQGLVASLLEDLRLNEITRVHVSLIHIYPFIVEQSPEFRLT
ncbi:unnamed protein product, partial [Brenthis ino]